jgi:hypothetical protein
MDKFILASARSLASQWAHLGEGACYEQVELHLESEFPDERDYAEISDCVHHVIDEVFPLGPPVFA